MSKIKKPIQALGIILFFLVIYGIAGRFDTQDAQAQHKLYCEMVAIWQADAARGVPANERTGWPPFDGKCN